MRSLKIKLKNLRVEIRKRNYNKHSPVYKTYHYSYINRSKKTVYLEINLLWYIITVYSTFKIKK